MEEKIERKTRSEKLAMEREQNLKYWVEQDALLFWHREEAYQIGGRSRSSV